MWTLLRLDTDTTISPRCETRREVFKSFCQKIRGFFRFERGQKRRGDECGVSQGVSSVWLLSSSIHGRWYLSNLFYSNSGPQTLWESTISKLTPSLTPTFPNLSYTVRLTPPSNQSKVRNAVDDYLADAADAVEACLRDVSPPFFYVCCLTHTGPLNKHTRKHGISESTARP